MPDQPDAFGLRLPIGFRCEEALAYFGRDPRAAAEAVTGRTIVKALPPHDGNAAILTIAFTEDGRRAACRLTAAHPLAAADRRRGHATAVRMLGLGADTAGFLARRRDEALVARLTAARPGLRPPLTATPFEALVWAIVGQQVTVTFATTLRRAVILAAGTPVPGSPLLLHPTPTQVAGLPPAALVGMGFSRAKAEYLVGAASAVAGGTLDLEALAVGPAVEAERALRAQRGLGPWTARYVMLRGMGFGDCTPVGDVGLAAALQRFFALPARPGPAQTEALMQPFAPHRSLATAHFWAGLRDPT